MLIMNSWVEFTGPKSCQHSGTLLGTISSILMAKRLMALTTFRHTSSIKSKSKRTTVSSVDIASKMNKRSNKIRWLFHISDIAVSSCAFSGSRNFHRIFCQKHQKNFQIFKSVQTGRKLCTLNLTANQVFSEKCNFVKHNMLVLTSFHYKTWKSLN